MVLFFIYDEFTDKVDGDGARLYAEMVMDAIRNPHKKRPQGEPKLGEIARQYVHVLVNVARLSDDPGFNRFWLRALKVSSPAAQTRFISSFSEYVYAVIDEASDRAEGNIRRIEDYLKLTRLTAGGYPAFVAVEAIYLTLSAGYVLVQYRASFRSRRTQHHYGGHERKGRRPKWGARLARGISRRGLIQVPGPAPHAALLGSCDRL